MYYIEQATKTYSCVCKQKNRIHGKDTNGSQKQVVTSPGLGKDRKQEPSGGRKSSDLPALPGRPIGPASCVVMIIRSLASRGLLALGQLPMFLDIIMTDKTRIIRQEAGIFSLRNSRTLLPAQEGKKSEHA